MEINNLLNTMDQRILKARVVSEHEHDEVKL